MNVVLVICDAVRYGYLGHQQSHLCDRLRGAGADGARRASPGAAYLARPPVASGGRLGETLPATRVDPMIAPGCVSPWRAAGAPGVGLGPMALGWPRRLC